MYKFIFMKKIILLFIPFLGFTQKVVPIKFNSNLVDPTEKVSTLYYKDVRENKKLAVINFKKEDYQMVLDQSFGIAIEKRFKEDNPDGEGRELLLLLEKFEVFEGKAGEKTVADARIQAATFEKKGDLYYYIKSINKDIGEQQQQAGKTPKTMSLFVGRDISALMKTSYKAKNISSIGVSEIELPNYRTKLTQSLPAYTQSLKDGIYLSGEDFFNQLPKEGYVLERNDKGKITQAKSNKDKVSVRKIFAYVEDNKAYLNTISGFLPLEKDEKGFYLVSNRGELEYVPVDSTYGMFGLIGGIVATIDQNDRQKKAKQQEKYNIYIDALTYKFIY